MPDSSVAEAPPAAPEPARCGLPLPPPDPTTVRRPAMVPPTSTAHRDSAVVRACGRDVRQPRRLGREQSPPGHPHRIALRVKHFHRVVEQHRRRGLGQSARPRLTGVGPRHRLVAQRRQRDAFGGPTAAAEHRHLHRLRPEQTLHPHQRTTGPQPVLFTDAAPQRQLQRLGGHHLHRMQPQHA